MVRGLVIRRLFVLTDLALGGLIVFTAGMVMMRYQSQALGLLKDAPERLTQSRTNHDAIVGPRSEYDAIVKNGLFGDLGTRTETPEPEQKVEGEPPPPTELNLRLVGTISLTPNDPFASAFIENLDLNDGSHPYALGNSVLDDGTVTLVEVYPRRVMLLNKQGDKPKKEYLSMDDDDLELEGGSTGARPPSPSRLASSRAGITRIPMRSSHPAQRRASGAEHVTLSRREFAKDLTIHYKDLLKIKPIAHTDESGNIVGMTTEDISSYPLAEKLGLRDGDVLQRVNGEVVDSEQKVMQLVQKYGHSSTFRLEVLRNGSPRTITYRLN